MTTTTSSVQWMDGGAKFRLCFVRPPVPASRPRVSKWGTYYGKTYTAYRKDAEKLLPPAERMLPEGLLGVRIEFVCERPKTTKRITPNGDLDNHMKSILDVLTKLGYWRDDMDIAEGMITKRFAEPDEEPHTLVTAWSIP